ncbi:hypothetical protein Ait01nite_020880 [Actinoplanes italicus]|nr:hypothetical protein Ait01nite_020880 [Actinoplanes italicus]
MPFRVAALVVCGDAPKGWPTAMPPRTLDADGRRGGWLENRRGRRAAHEICVGRCQMVAARGGRVPAPDPTCHPAAPRRAAPRRAAPRRAAPRRAAPRRAAIGGADLVGFGRHLDLNLTRSAAKKAERRSGGRSCAVTPFQRPQPHKIWLAATIVRDLWVCASGGT